MDLYPLDDKAELEKLALFGLFVAGKSAAQVWPKVQLMFAGARRPLDVVREWVKDKVVQKKLLEYKTGQYTRLNNALQAMALLPDNWTWRHLLSVPGIGYKSAKLVQIYTWPGTDRGACLDRHVLRWLRSRRGMPRKYHALVPDNSPTDWVVYSMLEGYVCQYADEVALADWELDRMLWQIGEQGGDSERAITPWLFSDAYKARKGFNELVKNPPEQELVCFKS